MNVIENPILNRAKLAPTRAKFRCASVTMTVDGETARFNAVTGGSEENKGFWKFTPSGSLELQTVKMGLFTPGKFYYLDFTEAEG